MVIDGFNKAVMSTATTTAIKSSSGMLHAIVVNSKGTVASTIEIYDATSATGTPFAIIDSLNLYGTFIFDVDFTTGLTLKTTGTVAPNVTIVYR
jgi:hypothetical protein